MIIHLLSPSGSGSITFCGEHDRADGFHLTTIVEKVTCPRCQERWDAFIKARGQAINEDHDNDQ